MSLNAAIRRFRIKYSHRCFYCGSQICRSGDGRTKRTRDHVVPTSRGGANAARNIAPCCQTCNAVKGDMTVEEFRRSAPSHIGRKTFFFEAAL